MLCMAEDGVVTPFLAQKDVKLRGLHNIENLLAAAAEFQRQCRPCIESPRLAFAKKGKIQRQGRPQHPFPPAGI